jgi:hypothetical protein
MSFTDTATKTKHSISQSTPGISGFKKKKEQSLTKQYNVYVETLQQSTHQLTYA